MPGTGKVLGSNLTRTCLFLSNGKDCYKKNCWGFNFLLICCRLSCQILELFFYTRIFYCFLSALFTPTFCNFTYLDFIFPLFFLFRQMTLFFLDVSRSTQF